MFAACVSLKQYFSVRRSPLIVFGTFLVEKRVKVRVTHLTCAVLLETTFDVTEREDKKYSTVPRRPCVRTTRNRPIIFCR